MKKIYYEKVGRRYRPVSEYDNELIDAFPKGSHLVTCVPGGSSRRFNIDPALAPMIAAGIVAEDKMLQAVKIASEGKPKKVALTKEQQLAWEQMKKAYGDDMFYLNFPSNYDIVQAGIKAMMEEANKLLTNPSVKKAYEHFMLVCELTKEHKVEEQ